ncbi:hypothetical protein GCM10007940_31120 [Portibacter lacus]|uniref:Penicillin-insensitive transglycosylase n=1 Tax=Portibacter lacus TaxID=1099794 RepID=A0AA37SPR2_9BACT|nr:hypothetical protein GCM10007940_31120 [Portibacter lacus]
MLSFAGIIFIFLFFLYLSKDDLPSLESLENPKYDLASIVYASDETPIGKYYIENRENVPYDSISPFITSALFATEDVRFSKHTGIDFKALGRVAFKSILLGQDSGGGGSTITQQLAKLLFDRPNLGDKGKIGRAYALFKVKLKEWITAVRIEKSYTKEEILAMYLNKFEFINGAHGIQAASQTYFGKNQEHLKLEEAAVLVGMLKNPSLYNPIRFPEKAQDRRDVVLSQMYKYDRLSKEERDSLISIELDMTAFEREDPNDGLAPYFRAELTKWLKDLFASKDLLKPDGTKYNIYTDGLKIYTTINPIYQAHAEAAMREHMKVVQDRYWSRWRGMDPYIFKADKRQTALRKAALMRRVYDSDRFESLFNKELGETIAKINNKYKGINISRYKLPLIIDYTDAGKLVSDNKIGKSDESNYAKLLKNKDWTSLQEEYKAFDEKFEEEFNTEIPMKVFAYNEKGEEEKVMSPLDSVEYHLRHLQTGILAVEPGTGYIRAWVGGTGFKYFKYDHVTTRRQVGSTVKPFVYSAAIAFQNISPCQTFDDIQYTIAPGESNFDLIDVWTPNNANESFTGNKYNLYQGLLYSKNSITVRLIKEMGTVEIIRNLLSNAGIDITRKHPNGELVVPNLPSISLGALDLTVKEMAGAYTTFANNGVYTEPIFIARIEDKNGKVIHRQIGTKRETLNPVYNAVMVDMLKNNVAGKYGLGIKAEVGGKTGTTNDYTDGWFMGITPDLVVGTWVGGDENWVRFFTLDAGQGFVMARPFFIKFIKKLEADPNSGYNSEKKFNKVSGAYQYMDCTRFKQGEPEDEQQEILKKKILKNEFEEEEFGEEEW